MGLDKNTKIKLANMLVEDIGAKEVQDGITYVLLSKKDKDVDKIEAFKKLQKEIADAGVNPNTILTSYDVANGVIFDMNLGVAKQTSAFIMTSMCKSGAIDGRKLTSPDLIGDGPDKRRYEDIIKLGKYLNKSFKEKRNVVDVALFSRNKVGTTTFNATKGGKEVTVKYNAYAIRHWDIEELNNKVLASANFKVVKVDAGEVLPSKNGVRFRLTLA